MLLTTLVTWPAHALQLAVPLGLVAAGREGILVELCLGEETDPNVPSTEEAPVEIDVRLGSRQHVVGTRTCSGAWCSVRRSTDRSDS